MSGKIHGPAAEALASLSPDDVAFLQSIPKAELHAHLHGSIPISVLQSLARKSKTSNAQYNDSITKGLKILEDGVQLEAIDDFFGLFPAIYSLISNDENLATVTEAVIETFIGSVDGAPPQCQYLELRTTPRSNRNMSRRQYLQIVLAVIERYPADKVALIVSLDWRMKPQDALESLNAIVNLYQEGRRIVGVDLCGDPQAADVDKLLPFLQAAQAKGLAITVHIAETAANPEHETNGLLDLPPSRLGHATFLNDEARARVLKEKIPIEICLSSNLLCKTSSSLADHHVLHWLKQEDHPICICTDDILPFRNSLLGEYALLLAKPPLGLGLARSEIERIAKQGMESRFRPRPPVEVVAEQED
ncbi:adenosine deaminase-like protein [Sistotremastrum niveocremeum HHB9708]|uniref:Adenosine deaminase-like protein n=1 Tax=Sistotremastrum niveocremeum HHB9708 TaxID=1314777 RepID=A0A164TNP8_9AGAM|nr:adenosine deaminase-like protein [Sistotremastrum niveocremeum HHB9708]